LLDRYKEKIREIVEEEFGEHFNLFFEFTGLMAWEENASMKPHHDR
jgi:hypothetical protein